MNRRRYDLFRAECPDCYRELDGWVTVLEHPSGMKYFHPFEGIERFMVCCGKLVNKREWVGSVWCPDGCLMICGE